MFDDLIDGNWRNDGGLTSTVEYKKKFALIPTRMESGELVWMRSYYRRQVIWSQDFDNSRSHPDKPIRISEADMIIRKLADPQ